MNQKNKKSLSNRVKQATREYLAYFQFLMLRENFDVNLKSILWFRFLYIINTIQVVQLINGQNVQNIHIQNQLHLRDASQIQNKFINLFWEQQLFDFCLHHYFKHFFSYSYYLICNQNENFSPSIYWFLCCSNDLLRIVYTNNFELPACHFKLRSIRPFNFVHLECFIECHVLSSLIEKLIPNLNRQYIYFNRQTSFYQIDGSFSRQSDEIIIFLFRIILCILKIKIPIIELQFTILLIESILLTIFQMNNTESNSHFILNLRIFLLVIGIAGIAKLDWIQLFLLYIFLRNIIQSYKNKDETNQLFQAENQGQLKLLISQIVNYNQNDETFKLILIQRCFKLKLCNLQPNNYNDIKIQDRLMIERYFQQNFYKLYFVLLSQNQQKMKFLDIVFVKAYTYLIQQECQSRSKRQQQDNSWLIRIFVQQETNFDILEQARITKLIYFQNLIKTNMNDSKYFKMIKIQTQQFCIKMQNLKKKLESNIDLKSQTLQNSDIVDLKTIQAIQKYYYVFYGDHQKAIQIGVKAKDQLGWDRSLNQKLQKNSIFLIQVSYLQKKWTILNPKAKYLEEYFKNQYLDNILDLFPQFLRGYYEQQLNNYIETEFVDNQQLKTFILKNNYIISCRIFFYHEVLDNDLQFQIYSFFKANNQIEDNNNFLLFDQFGKIFGISEQLFSELQKLDEYTTQEINYSTFLEKAMIQFYIPGIEYQVLQLISCQQCNQIEFQSSFSKNLNLDDCLQLKINFNLSEEHLPSIKRTSSQNFRKIFQDDNQIYKNKKIQLLNPKFSMQFESTQQCLNQEQNISSQNFQLEYIQLNNCDYYYFILHFSDFKNNLESQDRSLKLETKTISKNHAIEKNINMSVIEQIIEKKKITLIIKSLEFCYFLSLKSLIFQLHNWLIQLSLLYQGIQNYKQYQQLFLLFMWLVSGLSEIKSYQTSINFLINPQALTFSYAGSFLLQWNRYCVQSGLYNLSQYIEFQRQQKLNYAFTLWKGIHINYTLNLSKRSRELGMEMVDVIEYDKNNNKIITQMDYYSFYTISREKMVRVQKNTNYTNISTHDYSIFKANGFIRQNILTIFKFHDIVINDEIEYLKQKVEFSQTNFYLIEIIQIGCANVLQTALICFIYMQVKLKNRIFFLLSLIEINSINAQITQTKEFSQFTNYSSKSKKQYLINNKDSTEDLQQQKNNHTIQRLQNIKFSSRLYLIIPIVFMVCYGSQMIGAYYYRAFYYNNYKNSLLMTMNYIKFKKLFDSSILLGELIKTEHLIPSNPHHLINQTETVELYLMYADNSTDLFNKILDDLIVSDYFNYTMKNLILNAFRKDLCLNFTRFLVFYNQIIQFLFHLAIHYISQIKLPYKASDSYLTITQNGIGGVIQNYKKMVQQDYYIERQTLKYSKNNTQFINSQIHQNFFVQYAEDIQSCFFTCFSYFINESIYLSDLFIEAMSDYFNLTGIIILILYILFSGFWIVYQYLQIHQIKFVLLLLEPKLVQKKGIHPMLVRIMNQI